jgi:ABC-2 type transport system ATP-binding protein
LILDEPTEGLDPRQIVEIRRMIKALASEHTVLLSTHILPEVTLVCERVLIINRGRLVAQDVMADLTASGHAGLLEIEASGPRKTIMERLSDLPGVTGVTEEQTGVYHVQTTKTHDVAGVVASTLVKAGCVLKTLKPRTRSLEDAFIEAVNLDEEVGE